MGGVLTEGFIRAPEVLESVFQGLGVRQRGAENSSMSSQGLSRSRKELCWGLIKLHRAWYKFGLGYFKNLFQKWSKSVPPWVWRGMTGWEMTLTSFDGPPDAPDDRLQESSLGVWAPTL